MQAHSDAPTACRHTVSGTISLRSRGTFHHSLTVLSAIGHQGIFRLSGWSRQIHTGFLGPRATWVSLKRAADVSTTGVLPSTPDLSHVLRLHQRFLTRPVAGRRQKRDPTTPTTQPLPGLTPSLAGLSRPFTYACTTHPTVPAETERKVPQPRPCNARRLSHMERFSLIRFRSPLLTESRLLSPPAGTEMFHFPAFPPHALCVQAWVAEFSSTGFPHSDILESQLGCQLLEAYRRLLRPSSAPGAKASTVCP